MIDTKQALAEQVEAEVMACIGCHDCMLACPLPESVFMGIAELNAAVHLPTINNPRVARFVTACTQCQQCVPACPADLSRADMVLFNKMKLEDFSPQVQQMIRGMLDGLPMDDPEALRAARTPLESQAARLPGEFKKGIEYVIRKIDERLKELEAKPPADG